MSDLMLDVDQAGELKAAFRRERFTNELIKKLCEKNDVLAGARDVLLGLAEIKPIEHLIDCDADPFVPEGWNVEEHRKGGQIRFDPTKVQFFLSEQQRKGKGIAGNKLRKELADKPILNANVLDYLLTHPDPMPEGWEKDENGNTRYIYFWGTIYRSPDGFPHVRYLYWIGDRWKWDWNWLGVDWDDGDPAAVLRAA